LVLMAERCVFCRIVSRELPAHVVYESEGALAILNINPSAPSHTLVIPKAHVSRIEDLFDGDAAALFGALHRVVGPVQEAVGASASTIGVNNGVESGRKCRTYTSTSFRGARVMGEASFKVSPGPQEAEASLG